MDLSKVPAPRKASICRTFASLAICMIGSHCLAAKPHDAMAARVYPVKAIRFIIAAPPGGSGDRLGRLIAPQLGAAWNQAVVVDNRPGANGIIGTEMTARAAPDGYTIVLVPATVAINPSLYTRVPYDPVRDFAPITQLVTVPLVLVVHPSFAATGVADLVAQARAKPGAITFGSAGKGSSGHLALELFQMVSVTRFTHAPQKGVGAALSELLGAQVQAVFGVAIAVMPHVHAGRLKGLAVTGARRSRAVPELPTVAESGFPGFEVTSWYGVLAPAGTPDAIIAKLHGEIVRALHVLERERQLSVHAADAVGSAPNEFAAHIAAESRKWSRVIKQAGIRVN